MSGHTAENDAGPTDHFLVVEHTNQGPEDTQGETGHLFTVHYIVRHPESCGPDDFCPITEHIEAVGIEDALGMNHWEGGKTVLRHIADGLYVLTYWSQHYSGPEGDDWDAGIYVTSPEVGQS